MKKWYRLGDKISSVTCDICLIYFRHNRQPWKFLLEQTIFVILMAKNWMLAGSLNFKFSVWTVLENIHLETKTFRPFIS